MPELTTTAPFTSARVDDDALTTIVARSVLEAALAEDESLELWFDVRCDDASARVGIDLSSADLEAILGFSADGDLALTLDREAAVSLFENADVEAHGAPRIITIAVTSVAPVPRAPAGAGPRLLLSVVAR